MSELDQYSNTIPAELTSSEQGPDIKITCISNVYIRLMNFKTKGTVELGHLHPHDHATMISAGKMAVQVYDQSSQTLFDPVIYTAPAMVYIKKNLIHQLTALEDNTTALCIHAIRDNDAQIIDPDMLPLPVHVKAARSIMEQMGMPMESQVNIYPDLDINVLLARQDRQFTEFEKF